MAEEKKQTQAEEKDLPEGEKAPEGSVRDRRRITPEGELREPSAAPQEPQPESEAGGEKKAPPEEETSTSEAEEPQPRLPTLHDFLRLMLMELRAQAWSYLVRSAESGSFPEEERVQIQFGRDLYRFLLEQLQAAPDLPEEEKEELKRLQEAEDSSYYDVAKLMLLELHARGWQSLGLMPHPVTHLITTDLAQARQAIDTYGEILSRLESCSALSDAEVREFRRLKSDLQANYVQRMPRV